MYIECILLFVIIWIIILERVLIKALKALISMALSDIESMPFLYSLILACVRRIGSQEIRAEGFYIGKDENVVKSLKIDRFKRLNIKAKRFIQI